MELASDELGFGSYNLVKGILKNTADHYSATTLRLAVPEDVTIIGDNKRTILLTPEEVRETTWLIKISDDLSEDYWYRYPNQI